LKLKNNTKKIKWSTSNKKVATVTSKGKVKAKKAGKATITAKVGSKKYTCKVTVKDTRTEAENTFLLDSNGNPLLDNDGNPIPSDGFISKSEVDDEIGYLYSFAGYDVGDVVLPSSGALVGDSESLGYSYYKKHELHLYNCKYPSKIKWKITDPKLVQAELGSVGCLILSFTPGKRAVTTITAEYEGIVYTFYVLIGVDLNTMYEVADAKLCDHIKANYLDLKAKYAKYYDYDLFFMNAM
jgi:hypothetical protein